MFKTSTEETIIMIHQISPENMVLFQDHLIMTDKEVKAQLTIDLYTTKIHPILINLYKINYTEKKGLNLSIMNQTY